MGLDRTLELPDAVGAVRAYRCWMTPYYNHNLLRSMGVSYAWHGPVVLATCDDQPVPLPSHESPSRHCRCGLYALKTLAGVVTRFGHTYPSDELTYGAVDLWGTVIQHRDGYRAQRARVVELYDTHSGVPVLAKRYGVTLSPPPPELQDPDAFCLCVACRSRRADEHMTKVVDRLFSPMRSLVERFVKGGAK